MVFKSGRLLIAACLILPCLINAQQYKNDVLQSMSYSVVNGQVFIDPPTTPEPTFMETWFPWLSSSYTSVNSEDVDEAIINSVTGPPVPETYNSETSIISLPGYSQYGQQQQQHGQQYGQQQQQQYGQQQQQYGQQQQQQYGQQQQYQSEYGLNSNSNSPYLSNEEDNYIPSASINVPQQVKPGDTGYPSLNYVSHSNNPSQQYSAPSYAQLPQLPYPFNQLPGQTTTAAPFYQPILDFFGYGASNPADNIEDQLPLPFNNGQFSSFPNPFSSNSYTFPPPQFAQARKSEGDEEKFEDDEKVSSDVVEIPNKASATDIKFSSKDSQVKEEKYPCPKLGLWRWNGEVCIAVGPVPVWACKPNDLVMTGRVGVCRNKIFFPQGMIPLKNL